MYNSRYLRRYVGRAYLRGNIWIWTHLPASWGARRVVRRYGGHVHHLIQLRSARTQSVGTFFFRNRPELTLLIRLLKQWPEGATLNLAVIGCSKGAEVYSLSYAIKCARPDLILRIRAVDIDKDIISFAERGVYSISEREATAECGPGAFGGDVVTSTWAGQNRSIFERMAPDEIESMCERCQDGLEIRPRFREGITWQLGDARTSEFVDAVGLHDIVFANRFLCHMRPEEAELCLRNIARLVKPCGYLFASGVDLTVRTKVARELNWKPVTDSMSELHEGDPSLRRDWPLHYWGLEPLDMSRRGWQMRYASVFRVGWAE
jgi:chemotaxis methyl-accepting protein methylase